MTVGWGIVGCGAIAATRIAPAIRSGENAEFVACCSRTLDKASAFASQQGAARGYDDLSELADDPDVQAVYIATPNAAHRAAAVELLEGGKHVFCAAPLATSAEDADAMVESAASAGRLLGVGCQMRCLPALVQVRELIATGQLGELLLMRAGFGCPLDGDGGWRVQRALSGGGALMDLGPHVIDALRWLGGEIVAASGRAANLRLRGDVEDLATAELELAGGALATMDVAWCHQDASMAVFGSEGSARVAGAFGQAMTWRLDVRIGGETTTQEGRADRAYREAIEEFGAAVEEGQPTAPIDGLAGLRAVEVIGAIYESADCGERIELEE
ncbi:MAG: 1,5-anhydro-D-fructose reductase [Phycisphaerae bacterium]|nr:1,5-anhydro-D-fructose reductase [Phycisphaerae bacterium]